jgi:hypothetical protein
LHGKEHAAGVSRVVVEAAHVANAHRHLLRQTG